MISYVVFPPPPWPFKPTRADRRSDIKAVIRALPARRAKAPRAAAAKVPGKKYKLLCRFNDCCKVR